MRHILKALLGVFLSASLSCSGETPAEIKAPVAEVSADAICEEHGIQEAICTKCNPGLIPVFRAKKNFCEEHGFPESACPICHPEMKGQLIVQTPTKKAEGTAPPEDGTKVRLKTKETARMAGLVTVQAR